MSFNLPFPQPLNPEEGGRSGSQVPEKELRRSLWEASPRFGAPSSGSRAPLHPRRALGGAPGILVTWTGSPRWAAVRRPAESQDSRSSSSSPWRGGGSGRERLKRPPRRRGGRSRGRSAPGKGRGQASAGRGGRPEAAMFPQTAPRPGAAEEREDPAAALRLQPDAAALATCASCVPRAASGLREREVALPGVRGSPEAGAGRTRIPWKEGDF